MDIQRLKQLSGITEEPLELHKQGMFTVYANNNYQLVGGLRSGSSPAGMVRLKYVIYDMELFNETNNQESANIGIVELFIKDDESGEILGLVNIELKKSYRKQGKGAKLIKDLKDSVKDGLTIHDIQHKAKGFWDKVGTSYSRPVRKGLGGEGVI